MAAGSLFDYTGKKKELKKIYFLHRVQLLMDLSQRAYPLHFEFP